MFKAVLWAIYVHIVLLYSIFDIYFKSPIIHGMTPYPNTGIPPARRLVLMVADGLRAEALNETQYENYPAPYLRSLMQSNASWGISHTRVPTESRPGHVAIIAGIYEDPSAIWKGWKVNPVEFDTLFNQSNTAWCWGSPDIVNLFGFYKNHGNIYLHSYDAEYEDFSGKESTTLLDTWVFDKFEEFVKERSKRSECGNFCETKIVFFLHLLGLDSAGHIFKPNSKEYIANIKSVDEGVKRVVELMENVFSDSRTAYIFTADHGMTDWGSHGAGLRHETETPLIAWGAGIKKSPVRKDVNQADIAPLMATLLGVPIPMNSVGVLPRDYLNMPMVQLAHAIFANTMQLLEQYMLKQDLVARKSFQLLFQPYKPLTEDSLKQKLNKVLEVLKAEDYKIAIDNCLILINEIMDGLMYYQNYHQVLLLTCTVVGVILWIIYIITFLNSNGPRNVIWKYDYYDQSYQTITTYSNITLAVSLSTITLLLYLQNMNFSFYMYATFPFIMAWLVVSSNKQLHILWDRIRSIQFVKLISSTIIYICGIELLVLSFFNRKYISVLIFLIALYGYRLHKFQLMKHYWVLTSILLLVFPMLNVVGERFNISIFILGGFSWGIVLLWIFSSPLCPIGSQDYHYVIALAIQIVICAIAFLNTLFVNYTTENKQGLSLISQCISWISLLAAFITPLFGSNLVISRLLHIVIAFLAPYFLMSVRQEPLFFLILAANLYGWIVMEYKIINTTKDKLFTSVFETGLVLDKRLDRHDFRQAFLFLYFLMVSFFGTGNIASLNSFDPMCIRTFLSVFSPFTMMVLILVKILIPFLLTTSVFHAITTITNSMTPKLFFLVLVFCEVMTLHFLFMVKNVGSWLEIGESLSHFLVMNFISIFVLLLFAMAKGLTSYSFWTFKKQRNYDD